MSAVREAPFTLSLDGAELLGVGHWVEGSRRPVVIIVVGGPQYRVGSHRQFVLAARALAARGYSVVRFDYRGMGDSGGASRDFEAVDADIAAIVRYVAQQAPEAHGHVLLGLCDAAAAVLMHEHGGEGARGLVLMNPWARTPQLEAQARIRHYYGQRLLQPTFWGKVFRGEFQLFQSVRDALSTWSRARDQTGPRTDGGDFRERMLTGIERHRGRVLLLMSGNDLTAREFDAWSAASARWTRAIQGLAFERVDLPSADHTFSARADLDKSNAVIADWLDRLA
jgi:exosortase A-associated hydrolase 1